MSKLLGHLRRLLHRDSASSDWDLLRRFSEDKDEAAFSALIGRYGQLVLGIANRILRNEHDAEDVFQAVFGILARKAGALDRRAALSTWLHTVAFNLAVTVKKRSTMRKEREQEAASMTEPQSSNDAWEEIQPLLDAELERLPAQYRAPLTLCYLMGKTTEEAAQEIGCSPDAVRGRLARGRELLRNRLAKKGVAISSALLGTALAENAACASVSVGCAASALQVALAVAGQGTSVLSPTISALIQEGVKQMFMSKVKMVAVVVVAFLVLGAGAGIVAQKVLAESGKQKADAADKEKPDKKDAPKERDAVKKDKLEVKLVAKKDTYTLDLGGQSADDFRKNWKSSPKPKVDLVLEIKNNSDQDVEVLTDGGDEGPGFQMEVQGPGFFSVNSDPTQTYDDKPSMFVRVKAGTTHSLPITGLKWGSRRAYTYGFWTTPGDYTISFKSTYSVVGKGRREGGPITSNTVTVKVVEPEKK